MNKENAFYSWMTMLIIYFSFTNLWFKFLILKTMRKKIWVSTRILKSMFWTPFNKSKKNTGYSTIHSFNLYLLGMLNARCWGCSHEHGIHNYFSHRLLQNSVLYMNSHWFLCVFCREGLTRLTLGPDGDLKKLLVFKHEPTYFKLRQIHFSLHCSSHKCFLFCFYENSPKALVMSQ